jgi:transposase
MTYIRVGIDVSRGRSTVSAYQWGDIVVMKPHDVPHTTTALSELVASIKQPDGEVRIVMEHTGRYWLPAAMVFYEAGLFVSAVNPNPISRFSNNKLRNIKNDKADSGKLARYGLKYWTELVPYAPTEITRQKLLGFSRQPDSSNKLLTGLKNNLQAVVDVTFPGVRKLITGRARDNGHIKWVDFVCTFCHCDCIRKPGRDQFMTCYRNWCKRHGYLVASRGAAKIHAAAREQVPTLPYDADIQLLIFEIAKQLTCISAAVETWQSKTNELAKALPEYDCAMSIYGCGETTGPQLIAEIGDITRFADRIVDGKKIRGKKTLVQYAGVAPGENQSGEYKQKSVAASKKGSPHLRKVLFQVMSAYLRNSPVEEPVYQFLDRKRAEGKPYCVYMTAGANRFLRQYYAKVRDYLARQTSENDPADTAVA